MERYGSCAKMQIKDDVIEDCNSSGRYLLCKDNLLAHWRFVEPEPSLLEAAKAVFAQWKSYRVTSEKTLTVHMNESIDALRAAVEREERKS